MAEYNKKLVKIPPGVFLNISKKGVDCTAGMREASITFGKNGSYVNTGIPGTGFYSRQKTGGKQTRPFNEIASPSEQPNKTSNDRNSIGCLVCMTGIIVTVIGYIITGNFSWVIGDVIFLIGMVYYIKKKLEPNDDIENNEFIQSAKYELEFNHHTDTEKRILQNFIDCYTLVDEIDEEEGIIEAINESGKNSELLPEHEQNLQNAKDKLASVQYNVDEELNKQEKSVYEEFCKNFETLLTSEKVWKINDNESSQDNHSTKSLIIRSDTEVGVGVFNYIKSQYDIPIINDGSTQLFFYPKYLIAVKSTSSFTVIPYSSVSMNGHRLRFQEVEAIPSDAKRLGSTWIYVDKTGEPDKRFTDNRQIPVVEYGDVTITYADSSTRLMFSKSDALIEFADAFSGLKSKPSLPSKHSTDVDTGKTQADSLTDLSLPESGNNYFEKSKYAAQSLYDHIRKLDRNKDVKAMLDRYDEELSAADNLGFGEINPRLFIICLFDARKSYEGLGHKLDVDTEEGLGLASLIIRLITPKQESVYNNESLMRSKGRETVRTFLKNVSFTTTLPEAKFFVVEMMRDSGIDDDLVSKYVVLLYRFASIIAKADGVVTEKEAKWLQHIMSFASAEGGSQNGRNVKNSSKSKKDNPGKAEEELSSLIGLKPVKEEIIKLTNFIKIQQMREKKGMATVPVSYHCVFTGNPGTGKTTVARIVAGIYKNLGILKKGHLVETDRSGLVAEYVGQTAVKTNKIIDEALDGVLFIDEAYSLVQGGSNDYGIEAISTLLKRMEDDRDRLIVILAGYSTEMQQFIDSNPGLQSRFNRYIDFPDYETEDLKKIFMLQVNKNDYKLSAEAENRLVTILDKATSEKDKNFGNGRYVRNLFEKTIENQASRLSLVGDITNEMLSTIEVEDIPN